VVELLKLKANPDHLARYRANGQQAMLHNRWDSRAAQMLEKFAELV